jgi:hypothetical protein
MKQRQYTLLVSLFIAICLITNAAYSQSTNSGSEMQKPSFVNSSASSTVNRAEPNADTHEGGAFDFDNIPASPEEFIANHPRLAKAWKFLNNESFRASIEKPMTVADKQTIESKVTEIKGDIETLKALRPQWIAAHKSEDTAQIHELFHEGRPAFKQIRADRKIIIAIIAKYKNASTASSELLDPVYPNPVTLGGSPATVSYHLNNDGPVNITITDASGNIVKQISNVSETAGDHTISVGPESISKVGTYYVTVEADNIKSTQKVAAVQ